jgi:hypothetical protein
LRRKALQRMKRLAEVFEDEDWGWKDWIKIEGKECSDSRR